MRTGPRRSPVARDFAPLAALALIALAARSEAVLVPGGGNARTDCFAEFTVEAPAARSATAVECTDGDPACDRDGACDGTCRFGVALCANQPGRAGCTPPPALRKLRPRGAALPLPALDGSGCGAVLDVDVRLGSRGPAARARTKTLRAVAVSTTRPRRDRDRLRLTCLRREGPCPPPTTSTTTTTLPSICGNGGVEPGEQCDPPCGAGTCGAGSVCTAACQCVAQAACACGVSAPTGLSFTTAIGSGSCGTVRDGAGAPLDDLICGGLYFGGGASFVTLPSLVFDRAEARFGACCSGDTVTLVGASASQTGSERTCTTPGCPFGSPLPIPHFLAEPLSTCLLARVARPPLGETQCTTGAARIDLPVRAEVHLFGDLLNGATAERPDVPGVQPCPICATVCAGGAAGGLPCASDADCSGGACGATPECVGGARHTLACTPGTSVFGACRGGAAGGTPCTADGDCPGGTCNLQYPTSQDCLPPVAPGQPIGQLEVPFALTTGTATRSATDLNGPAPSDGADVAFCGFCRDTDGLGFFGVCRGGASEGAVCAQNRDCPDGTCGEPRSCRTDADCVQPREACEQRDNGAFGALAARTIEATGAPAGDLTDRQPRPQTLVSVFCVPPTFSPSIDGASDLPGPGAVSLPGQAELLP